MFSFRERKVFEKSRCLKINGTLTILVNQDSNSNIEDKFFDFRKRKVRLKQKVTIRFFDGKIKQVFGKILV